MAGAKNLDYIEAQTGSVVSLLNTGKTADALNTMQALIPWIQGEKKKIVGEGNTLYSYACTGCSLGCKSQYKFVPATENLTFCPEDGSKGANFVQIEISVDTATTQIEIPTSETGDTITPVQ